LRELFTTLEFTSLLKELLPVVEVGEAHYSEAMSAADVRGMIGMGDVTVGRSRAARICGP